MYSIRTVRLTSMAPGIQILILIVQALTALFVLEGLTVLAGNGGHGQQEAEVEAAGCFVHDRNCHML